MPKPVKSDNAKSEAEKYDKKTPREHVLIRPDTYIGDIEPTSEDIWIYSVDDKCMVKQKISYTPGFLKVFDELLVNARDASINDSTCDTIKVEYNVEEGFISVWNNGDIGIPVEEHPTHKILVPSMIFGELLTSSNYNDDEERTTGGRNGYGSKLCNIFATKFIVEVDDAKRSKRFRQEWSDNMLNVGKPEVTKLPVKTKSSVKVTFYPDFKRFGIENLKNDHEKLFYRRSIDIAGTSNNKLKVFFNEQKIDVSNFKSYIEMYYNTDSELYYDNSNERWTIGVLYKPDSGGEVVSFVNSINTYRGGTHCTHVMDNIIKSLINDYIKKKDKDIKVTPALLKENLIFFINSIIINPAFSSQTKDTLTSKIDKFGSKYEPTPVFMKKLAKSGIVEQVIELAKFKENAGLKKTDGKKQVKISGIPKLEDANKAGTKDSNKCTLILTEGDSAKATAMAGLAIVGRDYWGVFPLKGKLLNVREASVKKLLTNEEITNLKLIIGLKQGEDYTKDEKFNTLRYGHVLLLTDQDSVTGDTPLLLKNNKGLLEIRTIDDLSNCWSKFDTKEVAHTNFQIWTDNGWTNIKQIIRHKVAKKIYRVLTDTGVVDVTEDHSLIDKNNKEIAPINCKLGDKLLHSFPKLFETTYNYDEITKMDIYDIQKIASQLKIQYINLKPRTKLLNEINSILKNENIITNTSFNIINEEAYVMGLFWADGSCGIYNWDYTEMDNTINKTNFSWYICNINIDLLNESLAILSKIYPDNDFKIIKCNINDNPHTSEKYIYNLILNGGEKSKEIIEKYRNMFYDNNNKKKIPVEILNSHKTIREEFYRGYYNGYECQISKNSHQCNFFDIDSKIGAHGMYLLCKSIGYDVYINLNPTKPNVYTLTITKDEHQTETDTIKQIIDLGTTEQYVYDLETENHHFQAGIGRLIVHNTDGTHIKGLFINMLHTLWPSLIKRENFVQSLNTPIVKAIKGKNVITFYNLTDYDSWKETEESNGYKVKYYKGLGTSTSQEAKEYFIDIDTKLINYFWENVDKEVKAKFSDSDKLNKIKSDESDSESEAESEIELESDVESESNVFIPIHDDDDAIRLAFDKKRANDRKKWLMAYNKNNVLKYEQKEISYFDFIHSDLIHFSNEDLIRSIPSVVDGLKPSQRKILYGAFLRGLDKDEVKVAQLAGFVSDKAAYHHGEVSLMGAIVGMAQNFVGSNNINILMPNGQFGTRLLGGKDSASPRYIWTKLEELTPLIFNPVDFPILNHQDDDGMLIEPEFYAPIIPMILVNGTEGIGTGFSTQIPPYNPIEIIHNLRNIINGEKFNSMDPWWNGFEGIISKIDDFNYEIYGTWSQDDNKIIITELPVGEWTTNYKEYLEKLLEDVPIRSKLDDKKVKKRPKKENPFISYKSNITDTRVYFELTFEDGYLDTVKDIDKQLHLYKKYSITNMHLYGPEGHIKHYKCVEDIMRDYYKVRLEMYQKRKDYQLAILEHQLKIISYKVKFILMVVEKKLEINNKKKQEIEDKLEKLKFPQLGKNKDDKQSYDYLLSMPLYNLTQEKIEELKQQQDEKETEYKELNEKTIQEIWLKELDELEVKYEKWYQKKLELEKDIFGKKKSKKSKK